MQSHEAHEVMVEVVLPCGDTIKFTEQGVYLEPLVGREGRTRFVSFHQTWIPLPEVWQTRFMCGQWQTLNVNPESEDVPAKTVVRAGLVRIPVRREDEAGATYFDLIIRNDMIQARRFDEGDLTVVGVEPELAWNELMNWFRDRSRARQALREERRARKAAAKAQVVQPQPPPQQGPDRTIDPDSHEGMNGTPEP